MVALGGLAVGRSVAARRGGSHFERVPRHFACELIRIAIENKIRTCYGFSIVFRIGWGWK